MKNLDQCPVCSCDKLEFSCRGATTRGTDSNTWTIVRCTECCHEFMNPQPSWDELATYYSASYPAYKRDHGATNSDAVIVAEAKRTGTFRHIKVEPTGRLLDVGCGGGFFLRIMKQLGFQSYGVEPSEHGAEMTRREDVDVFHGTLEQFLKSDEKIRFDVITSSHVLEHVPDPVETLGTMRQLLSRGGYIWISVPNAGCFSAQQLGTHWHSRDVPFHLQQFTCESMSKAAEIAGLRVRNMVTYLVPDAVAASIRQYLRRRWLIPARISRKIRLIDTTIAPRLAQRLDRDNAGESILVTLENP